MYHFKGLQICFKDTEKPLLFERTVLFEVFDLNFFKKRPDHGIDKFVFMFDITA